MNWREHKILGIALLFMMLAPAALAHGGEFDPLVVAFHGLLTSDGAIIETPPPAGSVAFPASTPAAPGAALRFVMTAPIHFQPGAGLSVALSVRASAPVLAGDGLEISIEPGGETKRVSLGPALAPDAVTRASVTVAGAAEYAKGAPITLVVRALAPALSEGALSLVIGGEAGSAMDVHQMRVPSLADLELQETSLPMFLLESETFQPTGNSALVHTFVVGHTTVQRPTSTAWSSNGTYLIFRGEESPETAQAHAFADRDRRNEAAHAFLVNGALVRVHPGVGVVVRATSVPTVVVCAAHCPAETLPTTFTTTPSATEDQADRPSALIPPPRDTRGIPVSEDAPPEKATPGIPLAALLFVCLMLTLATRGRK